MEQTDISFFDPKTEWAKVERGVPHWSQAGCVCFVTWRLHDSLPAEALDRIDHEFKTMLQREGLAASGDWKHQLAQLSTKRRGEIQWKLFATRDKYMNQGFGACHLANQPCSTLVLESLKKFDLERYFLIDAVIMPNHVHFLCAFADGNQFLKQCAEWKRYTGRQLNQALGLSGEFWQVDQFDHLIRSPEQFAHYRRYIAMNPIEAKLLPGSYLYFKKQLT